MSIERNLLEQETEKNLPSQVLTHISATYPFLSENEYKNYMAKATQVEATSPIDEISKLVELLDNPHATFRKVSSNWNSEEHETNPEKLPSSELIKGVLYMKIPTFGRITLEDMEKVFLPYAEDSVGLVLDLRENRGGREIPARGLAEKYFIKPGKHAVGTNVKIEPEGELRYLKISTSPTSESSYGKPIVILTSSKTFSSAEKFVAIMKAGTDCKIIGTETFGGSANPEQTELEFEGQKYLLSIPTRRFFLEGEDKPIEETKIQPDIKYDGDDIANYAVKYVLESKNIEK